MLFEGVSGGLIDGTLFARELEPHEPSPAHERHGRQLIDQSRGIVRKVRFGQDRDVKRIVRILRGLGRDQIGPFADNGAVLAIEQDGPDIRPRLGQKPINIGLFGQNHGSRAPYCWRNSARFRAGSVEPPLPPRAFDHPAERRSRHRERRRSRR